jgi:hypothetical protein
MHDTGKIEQTIAAEDLYLSAFQKFLQGLPLNEVYRLFDQTLSLAPWDDSLRAQIYLQYSDLASTRRDPMERARLMQRAQLLYKGVEPRPLTQPGSAGRLRLQDNFCKKNASGACK